MAPSCKQIVFVRPRPKSPRRGLNNLQGAWSGCASQGGRQRHYPQPGWGEAPLPLVIAGLRAWRACAGRFTGPCGDAGCDAADRGRCGRRPENFDGLTCYFSAPSGTVIHPALLNTCNKRRHNAFDAHMHSKCRIRGLGLQVSVRLAHQSGSTRPHCTQPSERVPPCWPRSLLLQTAGLQCR